MVLDSSAIVTVHLREPGYERLLDQIQNAEILVVGVPTLLETIIVLTGRLGQDARPMVHAFLRRFQVEIVPFNEDHLDAAVTAFIRYGRGRHPAGLNFGDCMSYAIAQSLECRCSLSATTSQKPISFTPPARPFTDLQNYLPPATPSP